MGLNFNHLTSPVLGEPAREEQLSAAETELGFPLPELLRSALATANGWSAAQVLVFATGDLAERNSTLEVGLYAPGYLAIASDGGGRTALTHLTGTDPAIWVSDDGDLQPAGFVRVADSLEAWLVAGCPFEPRSTAAPKPLGHLPVDIYLTAVPASGLKGLMSLRQVLGLTMAVAELKRLSASPPVLLTSALTQAVFERRLEQLGELGTVLEARPRER